MMLAMSLVPLADFSSRAPRDFSRRHRAMVGVADAYCLRHLRLAHLYRKFGGWTKHRLRKSASPELHEHKFWCPEAVTQAHHAEKLRSHSLKYRRLCPSRTGRFSMRPNWHSRMMRSRHTSAAVMSFVVGCAPWRMWVNRCGLRIRVA